MVITILIFIVVLALLIFVHEFGHFVAAKKSGMRVDEFGFGFPPRLIGLKKIGGKWKAVGVKFRSASSSSGNQAGQAPVDDGTIYSINWIPLGGFVKIRGENNEHEGDPRSFINRPFWARFTTLVAGVAMNLVLAWVIISIGTVIGLPAAVESANDVPAHARLKDPQIAVLEVLANGPAGKAGLAPGDIILNIDNKNFANGKEVSDYIIGREGQTFVFNIERGGQTLSFSVASLANPGPDQGPTGIQLAGVGKLVFPWYLAPWEGLKLTVVQTENIASGLGQLATGKIGVKDLGGPVKIAQLTGQVAKMGFIYLLQFTAFLSLNLAILNILPFPALDGGRVLFLIVEKIRGKRNNQTVEQWFNTVGFALLILLMVFVTAHDVFNIFDK